MKKEILKQKFDIVNFESNKIDKKIFIYINEGENTFLVTEGKGNFKCLKIYTTYSEKGFGILKEFSRIFAENNISIFAFTSIDYGYFFFDEKLLNKVEKLFVN